MELNIDQSWIKNRWRVLETGAYAHLPLGCKPETYIQSYRSEQIYTYELQYHWKRENFTTDVSHKRKVCKDLNLKMCSGNRKIAPRDLQL